MLTINGIKHKKVVDDKPIFSVCMSCNKLIDVKYASVGADGNLPYGNLSHGICEKCVADYHCLNSSSTNKGKISNNVTKNTTK